MSRLITPALDDVPAASRPILDAVHKQLGVVPNMFRIIASSPAALQGFTANSAALAKTLDVKTRERIALAVAQVNGCDYCLSAHSYIGLNLAKLTQRKLPAIAAVNPAMRKRMPPCASRSKSCANAAV